jgi:hypothetical protein
VQYLSIKWSSLPFRWKGKTRVKRIYQGFVLNEEPVEMALIMPFSCNSRRKVLTNPRRNSSQHGNYKRTSSTPQASLPIDTLIGRFRYIGCRPSIGLECPRGSSIKGRVLPAKCFGAKRTVDESDINATGSAGSTGSAFIDFPMAGYAPLARAARHASRQCGGRSRDHHCQPV